MKWCAYCGKKLPSNRYPEIYGDTPGYDGNGFFCTLRCGFAWAVSEMKRRPS
jgi:hypothetical protein